MFANSRHFTIARAFNQLLHLIFPVLLLTVSASSATAQTQTLRDGMRVIIATPASRHIIGIVKSVGQDSVRLYSGDNGAVLSIAASDITSVRVSQGRSVLQGAKRGTVWGAGVGIVLAGVTALTLREEDVQSFGYYGDNAKTELVLQTLMGSMIWGAGIGAFLKREGWETVSMQPRVTSSSSGVRLGFSFSSGLLH